jgi:phosphoenolpyruvate carboxylase
VDDRALLHEVFTGVLAAAESERAVALHERAAALGERSRAGEHFHSTLSSVVPEFYRELEAAVAEVYPGEERLLTRARPTSAPRSTAATRTSTRCRSSRSSELLRRSRGEGASDDEALARTSFLAVNGIAAGMRNTG